MFDVFSQIFTLILASYLGFTNYLATGIENFLPAPEIEYSVEVDSETGEISYEYGGAIPDILIKNAAYQKASVIDSLASTTKEKVPDFDIKEAIVNIYCTYRTDEFTRTSTGTGVLVSDDGVILTNAHVAQFLLLEGIKDKGTTNCIIRSGEVATAAYEAELLYISPKWIQDNHDIISQANPKGTGQRDYALLFITKGLGNNPVPAKLPFIAAHTTSLSKADINNEVTIGGYPTLIPNLEEVRDNLKRQTATTTIAEIFTFVSKTTDIFNLRGSAIGEYGISGGPVINSENKLIGLIATKSDDDKLGEGSLNAITISYIDQTMQEETGFNFERNISGDLPYRAEIFKATIIPFLTKILSEEL